VARDTVQVDPALSDRILASPRSSTFHSLRYKDFRYLWQGQIGAAASQWMENLARPLLILELTNSAFLLGLTAAMRMLPMLFVGVWAGVVADRMDKRRILLVTQSVTLATHAVTAALILTGLIEPWMVLLTTFTAGASQAFNQPARVSLVPRVVPREYVTNAIALTSAAFNTMRTGGPAIAGLLLVFFDLGDLYVVQSLIYIWVMWSTWQISFRAEVSEHRRPSMMKELVEGFSAVRNEKSILYLLLLSLGVFVWGMPFQSVFIPLIGKQELNMSQSTVGLLISMVGIGALLGSLIVATVGNDVRSRGYVMLGLIVVFCLSLLVFARAETLFLVAPALIVTGAMQTSFMALNNTYVLSRTPQELHGRVLSLFHLDRGLVPLGATIAGLLAGALGPQSGLTVMASICLGMTLLLALLFPQLRKIS
jgi:MFS family permease